MRIVILGGSGQLGQALVEALDKHNLHWPPRSTLDMTEAWRTESFVRVLGPQVVINAAAFNDVRRCEREPELARAINTEGPRNLAKACAYSGARLIHVSTDYVFDGKKGAPYTEEDTPNPSMVYGETKLAGERAALEAWHDTIVLRTSGLFGLSPTRSKPGGMSFVESMLAKRRTVEEISVVDDVISCPTNAEDLARQIALIVERDVPPGVYHAVNTPGCSWFDLAELVFSLKATPVSLRRIRSDDLADGFHRPRDTRMMNQALEKLGLCTMRPLVSAVADYLHMRGDEEEQLPRSLRESP